MCLVGSSPGVGYIFVLLHQGYINIIVCKFVPADQDTTSRSVSLDWMPHYRITKGLGLSHVLQNKVLFACKFWLMVSKVVFEGWRNEWQACGSPERRHKRCECLLCWFPDFSTYASSAVSTTSAMVAFSTNQTILMPSPSILCRLSAVPQARNNNIEMHSEDLRIYNTLDESSRQLEAAMKLFVKGGKGKAAQEVELNEEDKE